MSLRFTVLASGSAGNASVVGVEGFGVLLDAGLGPRQLAERFTAADLSWQDVHALLLTHTHSDHWNDRTLAHFHRRRLPVYCHPEHHAVLQRFSSAFGDLLAANLVRPYEAGVTLALAPGLRCTPLPLRHDGGATFGFRLEGRADLFGEATSLAYLADLGCWDAALAQAIRDVDLLALEFNHDVEMEYASGRQPTLIARVLGDEGHLSNAQAAALLREVLGLSAPGRLRHVVQLHLSRDCNHPTLAAAAAQKVLATIPRPFEVHTARQDEPGPTVQLGSAGHARRRRYPGGGRRPSLKASAFQPLLPGIEDE